MGLVAYDNSSDSENEDTEESDSKVVLNATSRSVLLNETSNETANNVATDNSKQDLETGSLFTNLPQPKANEFQEIIEEEDEFLKKKEQPTEKPRKMKQPVRIGIPDILEVNSDEEDDGPQRKKAKLDLKESGLFSMLPPPKSTPKTNTCFVPNILQKKSSMKPNKPTKVPPKDETTKVPPKDETMSSEPIKISNDDDEDDDIEVPETFDDEMWRKICGRQQRTVKPAVQEDTSTTYEEPIVELAPDVEKPYTGLDNQAFKELVGSRKKHKVNIELIDIHEDEIRPDREEWLKSLTDPNCEPNTEIKNPVNNTCKVKNHITSLAQKALANDKELQMRWAESRHNRRQTQAKYGF